MNVNKFAFKVKQGNGRKLSSLKADDMTEKIDVKKQNFPKTNKKNKKISYEELEKITTDPFWYREILL